MPHSEDQEIWQAYLKKVKPKGRRQRTTALTKAQTTILKSEVKALGDMKSHSDKVSFLLFSTNKPAHNYLSHHFDRRTERQLRDGSIGLEAKLDMHGMTQKEAYQALENFMKTHIKLRHHKLLIITGKGHQGQGVLRTHLKTWLEKDMWLPFLLNVREAAPNHGGSGAFYVFLRFPKDKK